VTTREKIRQVVDELAAMKPADADASNRDLVEMLLILRGFGFDPLEALLPSTDADADLQVDALITLLLQVRGDDLPPYDFERAVREATATDGDG
jgi:hypothetical protein